MTAVTPRAQGCALLLLLGLALSTQAGAETSLYQRLGGATGVAEISNALIDRVVADPVHGQSFKDSKIDRVKRLLAEQICELSGGPCHYTGDPMKEVHAGHHITEGDFYALVEDLRSILKQRGVSQGATNELLRLLAPMRRDVVDGAGPAAK